MKFLFGVAIGLFVAPTVNTAYKKNREVVDDKIIFTLQRLAAKFGMELYYTPRENQK